MEEPALSMDMEMDILLHDDDPNDPTTHAIIASDTHEDTTMTITEEEREWALRIREAVVACEEISNLSDFECAQYAIVTRGNVQEALKRAYGTQVFKEVYKIDDSVAQAVNSYVQHFQHQPGYILHLDVDEETHEPMVVLDLGNFLPANTMATSGKCGDFNWKVDITRCYYQNCVVTPSMAAIRSGAFLIIDCDNIGWENFSLDYSQRLHSELWAYEPVQVKNLLCYNTGSVANVAWNMIKHLMDANMREKLQLGCQLEEMDGAQTPARLRDLYLQPSLREAQEKMLHRIAQLMQLRRHNEANFRL